MTEQPAQAEEAKQIEKLFPHDVLPTRRFVVELPGYSIRTPEATSIGRGYQAKWFIYPNWVGGAVIEDDQVGIEIRAYYAITRFAFKKGDTIEEWLLEEEGGKGFTLKLYDKGVSAESIVESLTKGGHFFARVLYRQNKKVDYGWKFPEPNHEFPVVTERDILITNECSQQAIDLMKRFKGLLNDSKPKRLQ